MPAVATLNRAPQRRKVFDFICAEVRVGKPFPTMRAVADYMGWKNESSANSCLSLLAGLDRVLAYESEAGRRPMTYSVKKEYLA